MRPGLFIGAQVTEVRKLTASYRAVGALAQRPSKRQANVSPALSGTTPDGCSALTGVLSRTNVT